MQITPMERGETPSQEKSRVAYTSEKILKTTQENPNKERARAKVRALLVNSFLDLHELCKEDHAKLSSFTTTLLETAYILKENDTAGALAEVAVAVAADNEYVTIRASDKDDIGGIDLWIDTEKDTEMGVEEKEYWAIQVKSDKTVKEASLKEVNPRSKEGAKMAKTAKETETIPQENRRVKLLLITIPGGVEGEAYNMRTGAPSKELQEQISTLLYEQLVK